MSLGHVNVSAPRSYAMPGEAVQQYTPDAIATVSLYGPRGGFLGAEEIDVERAREVHRALGTLIAEHDASDDQGSV